MDQCCQMKQFDCPICDYHIYNVGTHVVQQLLFAEFKDFGDSNTRWTLNSYNNVNTTSLFSHDVYRQKIKTICLTIGVAYKTFFIS